MREVSVKRKDLWASLGNIKLSDWKRAADKLGLPVTAPDGGSSHLAIRKPSNPIDYGIEGLIITIYSGMSKQVNGKVFKRLLECGIKEDTLWKALGKL